MQRSDIKELTRIFCVFWTDVIITCVKNIFIYQGRSRRNLSEEGNLNGLSDLHSLSLVHEYLTGILAAILAIKGRNPVLLWVMTWFKWL